MISADKYQIGLHYFNHQNVQGAKAEMKGAENVIYETRTGSCRVAVDGNFKKLTIFYALTRIDITFLSIL